MSSNRPRNKAGVIGWPVEHSLSPKLHRYWLKHYKLEGEYNAYAVKPDHLGEFVASMPAEGFAGCNVTIPHKEAVIPYLDWVSPLAQTIGAVNTILVQDGKLHGYNTDYYGFLANIRPWLHANKPTKALVLGAGGAAKSIWHTLKGTGFSDIHITNRTEAKLEGAGFPIIPWEKRSEALKDIDLLVNATSLGMTGQEPLEIDLGLLPSHALVTDIVYKPLITPLLKQAEKRGLHTIDGLGMLLHQGAPGFASWFMGEAMNEIPGGLEKPAVTQALRDHILS